MNSFPPDFNESTVPEQWAEAVVLESVHCRKCGYDLRGLKAGGRCPECGFRIWASVHHSVDPTASRLPSIRNPRAVGNGLLALTVCMLAGMLLMLVPRVVLMIEGDDRMVVTYWEMRVHPLLWIAAVVIGVIGLWGVLALAPPRGAESNAAVSADIWRIAVGFAGWLLLGCLWIEFVDAPFLSGIRQRLAIHLAAVAMAAIGLFGLRSVLNVIGHRSREYRRSRGGRQSVELIIVAAGAAFLGAVLHYIALMGYFPRDMRRISTVMVWASHFMVVVGLCYLVMNAWWIRRALRKPPPPIDQVLAPNLPPDTWIPDREE